MLTSEPTESTAIRFPGIPQGISPKVQVGGLLPSGSLGKFLTFCGGGPRCRTGFVAAHRQAPQCSTSPPQLNCSVDRLSGYKTAGTALVDAESAWMNSAQDSQDEDGIDLLFFAIINQDFEAIRKWVQSGKDLAKTQVGGMSVLGLAVSAWGQSDTEDQKIELCRFLIELGAPVNQPNDLGATALDDATMSGFTKLAAFLRSAGARPGINPLGLSNLEADSLVKELGLSPGQLKGEPPSKGSSCLKKGCLAYLAVCIVMAGLAYAAEFFQTKPPELTPAESRMRHAEKAFQEKKHSQVVDHATRALLLLKDEKQQTRARKMIVESAVALGNYKLAGKELQILLKQEPDNDEYKSWKSIIDDGLSGKD